MFNWMFGLQLLPPRRVPVKVSVCSRCRNRPQIIATRQVFAYWCPSCRRDLPLTQIETRIHWEQYRLIDATSAFIVNCVA